MERGNAKVLVAVKKHHACAVSVLAGCAGKPLVLSRLVLHYLSW